MPWDSCETTARFWLAFIITWPWDHSRKLELVTWETLKSRLAIETSFGHCMSLSLSHVRQLREKPKAGQRKAVLARWTFLRGKSSSGVCTHNAIPILEQDLMSLHFSWRSFSRFNITQLSSTCFFPVCSSDLLRQARKRSSPCPKLGGTSNRSPPSHSSTLHCQYHNLT